VTKRIFGCRRPGHRDTRGAKRAIIDEQNVATGNRTADYRVD